MGVLLEVQRSAVFDRTWRNRLLRWGGVSLGEMVRVMPRCQFGPKVSIGEGTFINYGCFFDDLAPISVGEWCLIGQEAAFITSYHDHHRPEDRRKLSSASIELEDHVWIGARAVILPGVTIGHHAIVGAGAVVTHDLEPWEVCAGVPARPLDARRPPE